MKKANRKIESPFHAREAEGLPALLSIFWKLGVKKGNQMALLSSPFASSTKSHRATGDYCFLLTPTPALCHSSLVQGSTATSSLPLPGLLQSPLNQAVSPRLPPLSPAPLHIEAIVIFQKQTTDLVISIHCIKDKIHSPYPSL